MRRVGGGGNPEQNEQPITPAGQVGDKGGTGTKIYSQIKYKGTVKVNGEVRDVSRRVYQLYFLPFSFRCVLIWAAYILRNTGNAIWLPAWHCLRCLW